MTLVYSLGFIVALALVWLLVTRTRWPYRLYLMRVPLVLWAVTIALPAGAIGGFSLATGFFDADPWAAFTISFCAFFAGWQALLLAHVVWDHGRERFPLAEFRRSKIVGWAGFLLALLPGTLALFAIHSVNVDHRVVLWLAGGLGCILATALAIWIHVQIFPIFPRLRLSFTPGSPFRQSLNSLAHSAVDFGAVGLKAGYFDRDNNLLNGHLAAAVLSLIGLTISLVFYLGQRFHVSHIQAPDVYPVIYIYLLCTTVAWVWSGITFNLDAIGTPTLSLLVLWGVLVTSNPANQHYFEITSSAKPVPAASVDLRRRALAGEKIVIVSADGGGIHSAVWTARVLTEITRQEAKFQDSIALLSGVSGGSVGMLYYQSLYLDALKKANGSLDRVIEAAEHPGLSEVTYGLMYLDLTRAAIPFLQFGWEDRSTQLEGAWRGQLRKLAGNTSFTPTLRSTGKEVEKGEMPALLFNSTIADTGDAFALSNTTFTEPDTRIKNPVKSFYDLFEGKDIDLVTAVRLSASFPYVSPPARPQEGGVPLPRAKSFAFTDGGYYDNYGVVNALAWIRSATSGLEVKPKILWIQIRCSNGGESKPSRVAGTVIGPVHTLYETRSASQRGRAEQLNLLLEMASKEMKIDLTILPPIEFLGSHNPLSWKLTCPEKERLKKEIGGTAVQSAIPKIKKFLK